MTDYLDGQMTLDLDFGAGRTYPEHSAARVVRTSVPSSKKSRGSKTPKLLYLQLQKESGAMPEWLMVTDGRLPGEHWMPNISESPNAVEECFLSQILMAEVPEKYFLSEKACLGIIRRSSIRGKTLPEVLLNALKRQAGLSEEQYEQKIAEWLAE